MKKFLFLIFILCTAGTLHASVHPTLVEINKENDKDTVAIRLGFDFLPAYDIQQTGKRVDIHLKGARIAESALNVATDDELVKFLPLVEESRATLSFFFRYKPRNVSIAPGKGNTLLAIVNLGDIQLNRQTDLISDLEKSADSGRKRKPANPLLACPFSYDWRLFFSRYESKVTITVPVQYTLPPFPLIALLPPDKEKNLQLIPAELNKLASTGQWNAMSPLLAALVKDEKDLEKGKKLALTYGEVLRRAGNFEGAYKQLYLLIQSYPDQPIAVFAKYLLAGLEAEYENPFIGDYKLQTMASSLEPSNPLTPYFVIAQIETAFATGQIDKMKTLLSRDNIPYPDSLLKIKDLRQADYWYASKNRIKAYVLYQMLNDPSLIERHYASLNCYCDTLYQQRLFPEAAQCYQKLAPHVTDKSQLGMVGYRKAMSELHFRKQDQMIVDFSTLADAFPDTDAGYKAAIKRTDLRFLTKINWEAGSAQAFHHIAESAVSRDTVEEAALKEALVYKITGKSEKAVDLLMSFLRNFRSGDLIQTAQAALVDTFPDVFRQLVDDKEYMKALVLAKQNQILFTNNWVDIDLLSDVAKCYQALNLLQEAKNTYQYLIDQKGETAEKAYLPSIIDILYHQGRYDDARKLAEKYAERYPDGKDTRQVFVLRLRAMLAAGEIDKAIALLPSDLSHDPELRELAANLYFQKNDYKKISDILLPLWDQKQEISRQSRFMLAESLFQQGIYDKSETVFDTIKDASPYSDQALFRIAGIERKKGETEKAVKLYQQLVEKGKDPLWRDLAKKELEIMSVVSKKL